MLRYALVRFSVIAIVIMAGVAGADDAFNRPVVFDQTKIPARQSVRGVIHIRQWPMAFLHPESVTDEVLREATEHSDRDGAISNMLRQRPPMAALDSGPVGIQVCALYAQQRSRLFRHYRALVDLTDMGNKRIISQLADWLYRSAKSEGVDFVIVWSDDILSEQDEAQSRLIIVKAVSMVIEMLEHDDADMLMLDELRDYLRRI